jgi:alpha/beta superfamily hydrolase
MEQQVSFRAGDNMLEGLFSRPSIAAPTGVVLCHPHPLRGGEMRNNIVTALTNTLARAGMATLRFNFRGVGQSTGTHDAGRGELDDVCAAVTFLLEQLPLSRVVVAGYSFGAMAGLRAGADDSRVDALIGVALPVATRDATFLSSVTKPKLLISGDRDDYSPMPRLLELFASLPEPKSLETIQGADHFLGGFEHEVARAALDFLTGRSPSSPYGTQV